MTGKKASALVKLQTQAQTEHRVENAAAPGGPKHCRGGRTVKPTQASRRGDGQRRMHPQGERTKGNRPGPKPSDDRAGNRPGGNGGGVSKAPAAMKNLPRSSAGTAQRNQRREGGREPQEEEWQKVQGKSMKAAYEEIERMAETLRRLVDKVTYLQQQGRETYRKNNRDSNLWSPLAPKAARRRKRSIGDQASF